MIENGNSSHDTTLSLHWQFAGRFGWLLNIARCCSNADGIELGMPWEGWDVVPEEAEAEDVEDGRSRRRDDRCRRPDICGVSCEGRPCTQLIYYLQNAIHTPAKRFFGLAVCRHFDRNAQGSRLCNHALCWICNAGWSTIRLICLRMRNVSKIGNSHFYLFLGYTSKI